MRIGNKEITLKKFASKDSSIWVLIPTILYTKDVFFLNEKKRDTLFIRISIFDNAINFNT